METRTIIVSGMSNREFLETHAQAGRVGLCGGTTKVDLAIRHAQRRLHAEHKWSDWSHAFFFEGKRADGHHWVLESDIQIMKKNIQLGAQENRTAKYFDEQMYPALAVLDFGLTEAQVAGLIADGLERVANRERYSVRELFGTLLALQKPELRAQENRMARERSSYCSAFVIQLFQKLGMELVPGITGKNTTPEDIARSPLPHTKYLLVREMPGVKIARVAGRLKAGIRAKFGKRRSK